jgi:hypothetical protein
MKAKNMKVLIGLYLRKDFPIVKLFGGISLSLLQIESYPLLKIQFKEFAIEKESPLRS